MKELEDIIRLVNAEDIARGAGLTRIRKDRVHTSVDSPEYIHWDRVNQYAQSRLPYLQQAGLNPILLQYIPEKIDKESYIPLELAIQIISCADSDQAKLFQAIVSITVAREIDRMDLGSYAALRGYDAINAQGHGESGSYTVILNRTAVIFRGE